jgi:hypothetical protein
MAKLNFKQIENVWTRNGGSKKLAPVMAAIALAESGGYTQAHHTNSNGTVDRGLWQINSSNYKLYKGHNIFDPNVNAHAAKRLAEGGKGLGNWTTYNTGAYLKYLPKNYPKGQGVVSTAEGVGKTVVGVATNPVGTAVGLAGDAGSAIGGVVAGPVEKSLAWFGMRIVFALIIMGGGGLILLGLLLIGADLGLAAFAGAQNSKAGGKAVKLATRVTPAGRAAKAAGATKAARATELHGQRVRAGEAKIKTQQARATELRTRTRHRAAMAKQSKAQTERTQRESYMKGAADAQSPTLTKIRKQREARERGKKAA